MSFSNCERKYPLRWLYEMRLPMPDYFEWFYALRIEQGRRANIATSENEFCQNLTSQHTITPVDSEAYDSIAGHKHSLDQDTDPSILC